MGLNKSVPVFRSSINRSLKAALVLDEQKEESAILQGVIALGGLTYCLSEKLPCFWSRCDPELSGIGFFAISRNAV